MLGPQLLERRQPQAGGASHTHRGASVYVKVCQGDFFDHVHVRTCVCACASCSLAPRRLGATGEGARGVARTPMPCLIFKHRPEYVPVLLHVVPAGQHSPYEPAQHTALG